MSASVDITAHLNERNRLERELRERKAALVAELKDVSEKLHSLRSLPGRKPGSFGRYSAGLEGPTARILESLAAAGDQSFAELHLNVPIERRHLSVTLRRLYSQGRVRRSGAPGTYLYSLPTRSASVKETPSLQNGSAAVDPHSTAAGADAVSEGA